MNKKHMIIGITFLLICVGLSGCNEETHIELTKPEIIDYKLEHSLGTILGDKVRIYGIIKNVESVSIESVYLDIVFYDAGNNIVDSSIIDTKPSIIKADSTACFYENIYDISYFDHYEISVSNYCKSINQPYLNLKITISGEPELIYETEYSAFTSYELNGYIENTGTKIVEKVRIWVLLYDSDKELIEITFSLSEIERLYSGQKESFKVYTIGTDEEAHELARISDYELIIDYIYAS